MPSVPPVPPLAKQTVLITGAAQGLGRALSLAFASAGATVVPVDFNRERRAELAASLPDAAGYTADLSREDQTRAMLTEIASRYPRIDTLIHNAGFLQPEPFATMSDELWKRTFNVGIQAAWLLTKALWSQWQATGAAGIFVSSRSGIEGFAEEAPYCATKHALEGLVKSLALEGAAHGIVLHTVTPGRAMRTPMSEQNYSPELKRDWVDPALLTPAFLHLAATRDAALSGRRLDAWALSQQLAASE